MTCILHTKCTFGWIALLRAKIKVDRKDVAQHSLRQRPTGLKHDDDDDDEEMTSINKT